jgi:hypothetical protein
MKTFLFAMLTFVGVAICAPQAEARDYHHGSSHSYYRGRAVYGRAYYPYHSYGYYRPYHYYPRARAYYGGYYGGYYPRYYGSYYGGCGYPAYYGGYYSCWPRLSLSFCF